jgi:hypothetical protein
LSEWFVIPESSPSYGIDLKLTVSKLIKADEDMEQLVKILKNMFKYRHILTA